MKLIGTGLNGLIGTRIVKLLSEKYTFKNLSRSNGVDITDYNSVKKALSASDSNTLIHLAAYTDVKGAEEEKALKEDSQSYKINVLGTKNVARACQETGKKLIYFSTDMVVGGENMPDGGFKEDANYNPLSWYAQTKYEAEKIVRELPTPWLIMRLAYPYRASFEKLDFVRLFIKILTDGTQITALTDRIISPTFIDDIANALDVLIKKDSKGIYNIVGSEILSIYDAAILITKIFNLDSLLVHKITRKEFLIGRPPEPFSSALNNDKIQKLGVGMNSFQAGLNIIKKQL
ncbi:MAG: hypothetical protein A3B38_03020 [Candidatus Levybacteria bacterium RIFCSPLOWO2_01_FULL_36_13]|nr:MAG: hypothetical protein A2684_04110 [Candidatus Levybacteria bacterium RIFCSPHIGHO2_01_FULL_36_15b]OGH35863.1 MAG: hypothetical protein A3B38_03020 [Candidatus Levybacteria bacterium RIFCSPLOWO2_01_FULL_36_13]